MKRFLKALLILVLFLAAGLTVHTWGFGTVRIAGTSMNNTLINGDVVLVTRFDYAFGRTPERGDIVECEFPDRSDTYIKRVIGLPDENILFDGGALYVNGRPISEPYISSDTEDFSVRMSNEEYLVLGDNRAQSYDSRAVEMGPIGEDAFLGKVRWILWPLSRFGPVD